MISRTGEAFAVEKFRVRACGHDVFGGKLPLEPMPRLTEYEQSLAYAKIAVL